MNWYKISEKIDINKCIKDKIRNNSFIKKMFEYNSIPMDLIDTNLYFEFKDLNGKKAQSDSKNIVFDTAFKDNICCDSNLHFLIHELYHWVKRQKEKTFYFADPEEVEAFVFGIAYEILRGLTQEQIAEIYYPIIEDHFDVDEDAKKMFAALFISAKKIAQTYRDN